MAFSAATIAVSQIGQTYYQGEQAKKVAKESKRREDRAQQQAESEAASEQRQADEAIRKQNRKQPDVGSLLSGGAGPAKIPTMLSGPGGVDNSLLSLGRTSLFGV